jgi:hypothetical protein
VKRPKLAPLGNIVRYQTGSLDPSTANPWLAPSFVGGRPGTVPGDAGLSAWAPGVSLPSTVYVPSVSTIGVQSSSATGKPRRGR